ncbi:MAG: GH25 family lysozyme [Clostridium sp.]
MWGLDVSSFQGTVNWNKVVAAGYRYAVLRYSPRGDGQPFEQYTQARTAGLKVGVYVFSYALTEMQAVKEAERAAALLNGRILSLIYLDLEWASSAGLANRSLQRWRRHFYRQSETIHLIWWNLCNTDWYHNILINGRPAL